MKANLFIASFLVVFSLIVHSQKRTSPVKNSVPNTMENTFASATKAINLPIEYIIMGADTVYRADTPKQYIFRYWMPAERLSPTLDTIQRVLDQIGASMSVDNANFYREVAARQIRRLIENRTIDSVGVMPEPLKVIDSHFKKDQTSRPVK